MSGDVRLSVGIPTFNQAAFIGETLESLFHQTRPAFEIVVSDNHCTDETPTILRKHAGQIRVVRPPRHLPMGEHWNFVLSQLSGDWFTLLSSDDLALPHFVETLSRMAAEREGAVLVRGDYRVIGPSGDAVKEKQFRRNPPRSVYPETLRAQLLGPSASFTAFAARTETVRSVGGFPDHHLTADWGLWLRLAPFGEFVSTPEVFSEYRQGHHSRAVEKARLPLWVQDETEIYTRMLPEIVARHGGVTMEEILAASRRRCRSRMAFASRIYGTDERTEIVAELRTWAESVGLGSALEDLERGRILTRRPQGPARTLLRVLGRELRARLGLRRRSYAPPRRRLR